MVRVGVTTQMGRRRDDIDGLLTPPLFCYLPHPLLLTCIVLTQFASFSMSFVIPLSFVGLYNYLRFDYIREAAH